MTFRKLLAVSLTAALFISYSAPVLAQSEPPELPEPVAVLDTADVKSGTQEDIQPPPEEIIPEEQEPPAAEDIPAAEEAPEEVQTPASDNVPDDLVVRSLSPDEITGGVRKRGEPFSDELIDTVAAGMFGFSGEYAVIYSYGIPASAENVVAILNAVKAEYPVEYDVANISQYRYGSSSGTLYGISFSYRDSLTETEFADRVSDLNDAADTICDSLKNKSDFEKIVAAHDSIVVTAHYESTGDGTCRNAYGILVLHRGVCQGYQAAYWLLLSKMGIPCENVISSGMVHGWNLVCFDGEWYHVDATWDDPTLRAGTDCSGYENYGYFFVNDAEIAELDHYEWTAGEASASTAFSAMPRGRLTEQKLWGDRWYFRDGDSEQIVSTDIYGGDRKTVVENATGGMALYDGIIYYGSGQKIRRYSIATGESDAPYSMPAEEAGNLPSQLPVRIDRIVIDGDGVLRYTYLTWESQGNGSYSSKLVDSEATFHLMNVGFATSLTLSQSASALGIGKTLELNWETSPESGHDGVIWHSSDESVATVSVSGVVTGKKKGRAVITATLGFLQASCEVEVRDSSGQLTDSLSWEVADDGTLSVRGEGDMPDFGGETDTPWHALRHEIQSVEVGDGVTRVGNYAFAGLASVQEATVADSVISLGSNAFDGCHSLNSLTVPFIGSHREANGTNDAVLGYFFGKYATGTQQYFALSDSNLTGANYRIPDALCSVTVTDQKVIPFGAFSNMEYLTNVTLYPTVEKLGEYSFLDTDSLSDIYFMGSSAQWGLIGKKDCGLRDTVEMHFTSIEVYAANILLTDTEVSLLAGATKQLTAIVMPVESTELVSWNSSDESVATVSETGLVTAVGPGRATVTAVTSETEKSAECVVTVVNPLSVALAADSDLSDVRVGDDILFTAERSGGIGEVQYAFGYAIGDGYNYLGTFTSEDSYLFTPSEPGNYRVYVVARDSSGAEVEAYSDAFTVKAVEPKGFTASLDSPQEQGTEIILTATGGDKYKFYSECGGSWKRLQDVSESNSCLWKPAAAGTYTLYADIMDIDGNVLECRSMKYVVTRAQGELSALMTAEFTSPQPAGKTIRLTVNATGGTGSLQYKFYSECKGVWTKLWDYSDRNTYNWHATTVGTHTVYCDVKDAGGKVVCTLFQYEIVAGADFVADLNANRISGQYTGTEIRLLAGSSNGDGEVQYKFYVEKDGVWKRLRDYGTQDYFLWTPSEAGFYNVYVDAKDSSGRIASKRLCITVEQGIPLKVTSLTADPASPSVGTEVTLTGTSAGGEGRITYKFYYECGGSWVRIQDFSTANTATFTPHKAGTYHIYMDAIDGKKNTQCLMMEITIENA